MIYEISKIEVYARSGANGRPTFGYARFADGRTYRWLAVPEMGGGGMVFGGQRKNGEMFAFRSPKREAALVSALNGLLTSVS